MLARFIALTAVMLVLTGCVSLMESVPPPREVTGADLAVVSDLPAKKNLPEQSASLPEQGYVLVQAGGGSVLLGPVLGSLNISARTRAMAENSQGQYLAVSPFGLARDALAGRLATGPAAQASPLVRPFGFLQHCSDGMFRVALVFHVELGDGTWSGRYTYHLPTAIAAEGFEKPAPEQVDAFTREMTQGAKVLADLLARDLAGSLPASGQKVEIGSLHLQGNKLGGMGIYTQPEQMYFKDAILVEETADYVTVRIKGNPRATAVFGGLGYGVHRLDRKLLHTFRIL